MSKLEPFWNHCRTVIRLPLRHLQDSVFRRPDVSKMTSVRAIFSKSKPYLDQTFWRFSDHFLGSFLTNFLITTWTTFGSHFRAQFGTRKAKERPGWTQETSGTSKNQKVAFSKTSKNHEFLKVFGSRGLRRKPQETQENSRESPKNSKTHNTKTSNWKQKWTFICKICRLYWKENCTKN